MGFVLLAFGLLALGWLAVEVFIALRDLVRSSDDDLWSDK